MKSFSQIAHRAALRTCLASRLDLTQVDLCFHPSRVSSSDEAVSVSDVRNRQRNQQAREEILERTFRKANVLFTSYSSYAITCYKRN